MVKTARSSAAAKRRRRSPAGRLAEEISKENAPDNPVVEHLQRQVANAVVLYLNYKHYHWQTYGPMFRDLHLLFDEFAESVLSTADDFAERVRMIGQDPVAAPQEMLATASVKVAGRGQTMRGMIQEADDNLLIVIKEMRAGARAANEADDPGTVDLFSRHVQIHEKHEWWLRDILEKRDGLTV
ncbi:MAG TPA: DNA starvation/stationary phase protection protein [Pyrinomonadaceae bacterium]|nr:DNA starvation/stationary phase protection protein [Pyrinomonadaceae bacterium]